MTNVGYVSQISTNYNVARVISGIGLGRSVQCIKWWFEM